MRKEIILKLKKMQDTKYKSFQSGLIPNIDKNKIIGVRLPQLRKLSKEIANKWGLEYFDEVVKTPKEDIYYEEKMLVGMVVGNTKMDFETWQKYMEQYVPFIDNWAVCDSVCSSMKIAHKYQEETWCYLQKYLDDSREFYIRFGVVMAMDYFLNDEYIDKVLAKLPEVKTDDYYAMMAVAWTVSVAFVKYENKSMKLIKSANLDIVTHNKSIQKIRESNRVNKEKKSLLLQFKRKE